MPDRLAALRREGGAGDRAATRSDANVAEVSESEASKKRPAPTSRARWFFCGLAAGGPGSAHLDVSPFRLIATPKERPEPATRGGRVRCPATSAALRERVRSPDRTGPPLPVRMSHAAHPPLCGPEQHMYRIIF
jgi:hypothetical protein